HRSGAMTLVLCYWSRHWQSVALDSRTGKGHIRWLSRKPSRCAGWAVKHEGIWYGLWHDGEGLILQAGALRVPMTGEHRASNVRMGTLRKFTVAENERVVFELTYEASDSGFALFRRPPVDRRSTS
ncbi:MAG TPA: hypothetical protein VLH36_02130, partial [Steroidobacteraceae bacterium]|nr:hypothetical protein [Steroidobacteraceae bacterium]